MATAEERLAALEVKVDEQARSTAGLQSALTRLDQKLDQRFDRLDQKVDERFETLDQKLDERFETLDQKVESFRDELSGRITGLDQKLDRRVDTLEDKMDRRFEMIDHRFGEVDGRLLSIMRFQFYTLLAIVGGLAGVIAALLR